MNLYKLAVRLEVPYDTTSLGDEGSSSDRLTWARESKPFAFPNPILPGQDVMFRTAGAGGLVLKIDEVLHLVSNNPQESCSVLVHKKVAISCENRVEAERVEAVLKTDYLGIIKNLDKPIS
jgi:hypothetical protein